jgi:predicted Rossmann-fold nucleotide-binding protein
MDIQDKQVITGGGPGMMEAGNLGAMEGAWLQYQRLTAELDQHHDNRTAILKKIQNFRNQLHSIGVGIIVPHEQKWNEFMQLYLSIKSFSPRKVGLVSSACGRSYSHRKDQKTNGSGKRNGGIFVLPGGFGTQDEFWEVSTLKQCLKMPESIPVIIVGKRMSELIKRTLDDLLAMDTIKASDSELFTFTNNEVEAVEVYLEHHEIENTQIISEAISKRLAT